MPETGLPTQIGTRVKESFAVASHMAGPVAARVNDAFVSAMHVALASASGAALDAAIGVSLLLVRAQSARLAQYASASASITARRV